MENFKLQNIDAEDIEDLLREVEKSFGVKFIGDELLGIKNFGELCDHIANKIQLENNDNCTSQQAFYKLRNAISTELEMGKEHISINKNLEELFPKKNRRSNLKKLERKLGFRLDILTSPNWVIFPLLSIFLLSFIGFFFNWKVALSGIAISIFGFWVASLTANEIDLKTVGELVKKMTRENYLKSRRNQETFNKKEIEKVLTDWFSDKLGLEQSELSREAKFV